MTQMRAQAPVVPPPPPPNPPPPPPNPPPPKPAVQVFPPVDVIRTVVAVTAPVVLAGPNALTQSPTAKAVAAVDCVSERVVVDPVVIFSFSVFSFGAFLAVLLDLLVEALNV
jgi:hypothetical protein